MALAGFFAGIHKLGPKWVVVTDGKDGAYIGSPGTVLHCSAVPASVAGTAGAGDAYISTFAACIAESAAPEDAAVCAAVNAASVISYLDTQTGLLRRAELDARAADLRPSLKITRWTA